MWHEYDSLYEWIGCVVPPHGLAYRLFEFHVCSKREFRDKTKQNFVLRQLLRCLEPLGLSTRCFHQGQGFVVGEKLEFGTTYRFIPSEWKCPQQQAQSTLDPSNQPPAQLVGVE